MKVVLFLTSLCLFFNSPNGELPNESCQRDGCPDQLEDELKNLDQADPRLVDIVKKKFLVPPPSPARQKSDEILHFCFNVKTRSLQHSNHFKKYRCSKSKPEYKTNELSLFYGNFLSVASQLQLLPPILCLN
jgi:hypothetical protein